MEITAECKKAAGIAARVLDLRTPYHLIFSDRPPDGFVLGGVALIHIDLSALPAFNPYDDLGIVVGGEMEQLFGAIFETYRQIRFLYQSETLTAFYKNSTLGWQLFRQMESDKTCEEWDRDLNGFHLKTEESATEADATAFAVYMFHRYPIAFPFSRTDPLLGKMKRRYRNCPVPESFNSN